MEGAEGTKLTEQVLPCWGLTLVPRWRPVDQRDQQDHITLPCFSHGFLWSEQKPRLVTGAGIYLLYLWFF